MDDITNNAEESTNEEVVDVNDLQAQLQKLAEEKENLKIALQQEREAKKSLTASLPKDTPLTDDVSTIVQREMKINDLKTRFNGQDGNPKFDTSELKEYAKEIGIEFNKIDPEQLYRLKYMNEIIDVKSKEVLKQSKGVVTADGKPITAEQLQDKLKNATSMAEIEALMEAMKK